MGGFHHPKFDVSFGQNLILDSYCGRYGDFRYLETSRGGRETTGGKAGKRIIHLGYRIIMVEYLRHALERLGGEEKHGSLAFGQQRWANSRNLGSARLRREIDIREEIVV